MTHPLPAARYVCIPCTGLVYDSAPVCGWCGEPCTIAPPQARPASGPSADRPLTPADGPLPAAQVRE